MFYLLTHYRFVSDCGWNAVPRPEEAQLSIHVEATIEATRPQRVDLIDRLEAAFIASRELDATPLQTALDQYAATTSRMLQELSLVSVLLAGYNVLLTHVAISSCNSFKNIGAPSLSRTNNSSRVR